MSRCPAGCQWGLDEQILVGGLLGGLSELARAGGTRAGLFLTHAFDMFVTWSQWNEDAHHDARYDVSKTLELYDAMFRVSQPL